MPRDLAFIGGISSSVITIRTSVMMGFFSVLGKSEKCGNDGLRLNIFYLAS